MFLMSKVEYNNEYNRTKTTTTLIRLNLETDADIIQKLNEIGSKTGYIKRLIRADIKKEATK